MIQYVVVRGQRDAVSRVSNRFVDALAETRLFDGRHVEYTAPGGGWAIAAISIPDPLCSTRLRVDGDLMTVVNGPALAEGGVALDEAVFRAFADGGASAVAASLRGTYNFVGISPASGLCALTDFCGLFPLYWYQGEDFALFSNRSTTLARVIGNREWDLRSLAWLIGHSNVFGERLPALDISFIPPGYEARVDGADARVAIDRSAQWVWPEPTDQELRRGLTAPEWDDITEMLLANFRALQPLEGMQLLLSGGKDSRLCLALAKATGLDDLGCLTHGAANGPEVQCAAATAEAGGFRHEVGALPMIAEAVAQPNVSAGERAWRRHRQHVYRFEAIVCPRDGVTSPAVATTTSIRGFGGELYKGPGGHAKQFKRQLPETVDEMAAKFVNYHQRHDPLGVLSADERSFQCDWMRNWVRETAQHVRLDVLPEKFYVDYRLGHWSGPLGQSTPVDIKLDPLVSRDVAAIYLQLMPSVRKSDRLHYEVIRRTAPELLTVPFLDDVWSPEIIDESAIELPAEPFPVDVTVDARTLRSGKWRFLAEEGDAVVALFDEAERDTDMSAVCDLERLRQAVREPDDLNNIQVKAIESSIGIALALLGRGDVVIDRA